MLLYLGVARRSARTSVGARTFGGETMHGSVGYLGLVTNRERILALIRASPGLTDTEIRERSGIQPHRQVNQICRLLAEGGLIRRTTGTSGRIINLPLGRGEEPLREEVLGSVGSTKRPGTSFAQDRRLLGGITTFELGRSMVVIPCSGAKAAGGSARGDGRSIGALLPADLRDELEARRIANRAAARVDESAVMAAADRYDGHLYRAGRLAIRQLLDTGALVLVISGGYGVVLADEPIGRYECIFNPGMWPAGLVERCLASVASDSRVETVIGVLSASTNYAKVFRRTGWPLSARQVFLAVPESTAGAMVKAPRAEGEFLGALAEGCVPVDWHSSDGLGIVVTDHASG